MASVKPKLQGYVREDLFIQFEDERRSLGLSQSQALEKMLLERYQLEPSKPNPESLYWITKSLEDLQARVKRLEITGNPESNLESNPPSNLESNPESNPPSNLESDSLSNLPSNLESNLESDSLSNLPSNLESDSLSNLESNPLDKLASESKLAKGLGQRALAKRLGCSYQVLGDVTIVRNGNIESWSKNQDPQGIGWELRDKKYYPCAFNVPSNVLNSESLESASDLLSEFVDKTTEQPGSIVICKFDKTTAEDPQHWRYWAGAKAGFIQDLREARLYTEKGANRLISQLLTDENHKPTVNERISSRAFEELLALGLI